MGVCVWGGGGGGVHVHGHLIGQLLNKIIVTKVIQASNLAWTTVSDLLSILEGKPQKKTFRLLFICINRKWPSSSGGQKTP